MDPKKSPSNSSLSLDTGVASCEGKVLLEAHYDDPWCTPITDAPVYIEDSNGVLLPGTLGGPTTLALIDHGLQDGHDSVPSKHAEIGTFSYPKVEKGAVTVALVADPSAQSEVNTLSKQISSLLDSFQSNMESELLPWINKWNEDGILSIPEAYRTGAARGFSEWWTGEAEFWSSVGNWVSDTFKVAIDTATQAAVDLWEWYDSLPWYDKLNPIGTAARDLLLSLWEEVEELWEDREHLNQIIQLAKDFVSGSVSAIEKGLEALINLPGELGKTIKLLVEKSAEWIQGLIEMIRETEVLEKLAGTVFAVIMMMTPNLWAEAIGTIGGYLLPEVLIAAIFAIIAALSAGAGSSLLATRLMLFVKKVKDALSAAGKIGPLLLKIFSKLDEIGKLITELAKALRRKIQETVDSVTDTVTKIVRRSHKAKLAENIEDHIKKRDSSVPRKRGIGGAHEKSEFNKALSDEGGEIVSSTPHPTIDGIEKIEYRLAKLDIRGNPTGELQQKTFTKTIYDSSSVSDEKILKWGQEAADNAMTNGRGVLQREWVGTAIDGTRIRGYTSNTTGDVTSFFPDF